MVSSLDGYIARHDNSVSWFDTPDYYEKGLDAPDLSEFAHSVDCYIMGAKTYQHAHELSANYGWPYGDTPTVVITHRELPINRSNISTYSGDLAKLIHEHLPAEYENIWIVGGPVITHEFIRLKLFNEIRISILPILLGNGVPFFIPGSDQQPLHVKDVKVYKNGLVDLCYENKKMKNEQC